MSYKKAENLKPPESFLDTFGIRSWEQVAGDIRQVISSIGKRFQVGVSSVGLIRPDLALPAYLNLVPADGLSPVYNLFDRAGNALRYTQRVTRLNATDFRGGRLSYDEHDGTDFVCPVGTPLVAAAPGTIAMIRDQWLRGGLTLAIDHGNGMLTQYSHLSATRAEIGQQVRRGEVVALSGSAGIDMATFFPLTPPHIHFMVWINGRPVDPFLASAENTRHGTWQHGNNPRTTAVMHNEKIPVISPVDKKRLESVLENCQDEKILAEFAAVSNREYALAALLEDSLHHDDWAWPEGFRNISVRPPTKPEQLKLTLPISAEMYRGVKFADPSFF